MSTPSVDGTPDGNPTSTDALGTGAVAAPRGGASSGLHPDALAAMDVFSATAESTAEDYPLLRRPGRIGHLLLPHRILMGAMHMGLEGDGGDPARLAHFYAERAKGGAALITTGGAAVNREGAGAGYSRLDDPAHTPALRWIAQAVHAAGGRCALQLFHHGRYGRSAETGLPPVAPSALRARINPETPRAMTEDDIQRTIAAFASGAAWARDAGYDAVEVMGSEGYLLDEFLSPLTNHREDAWGGSPARRRALSLAVIQAIRAAVGSDYPVIYRLTGADLMDGGTPEDEALAFARAVAAAGVDAINVGIVWHESRVPTVGVFVPQGAFAEVAHRVRSALRAEARAAGRSSPVPVLVANRIHTPEVAERVLASGAADFVAPARPFLADPAFAAKALSGRRDRLNVCVACNQACLDHVLADPPVAATCLVNPAAGREEAFRPRRAASPRRVAVVGGGPAGLEAARVLAARGHRVVLFEAAGAIGGQLNYARLVPGKQAFNETLRYYRGELQRAGVRLELGHRVAADDLAAVADAVVVATGVRPHRPSPAELPGCELPHVTDYAAVFSGRIAVGERIVILGGGGIACDLAQYLAQQGPLTPEAAAFLAQEGVMAAGAALQATRAHRQITVMRRGPRLAPLIGRTTRWALLQTLRALGVATYTGVAYRGITAEGVAVQIEGCERTIPADTVILATGQRAVSELAPALRGRLPLLVVGGAREAERVDAARAIEEAAQAALLL